MLAVLPNGFGVEVEPLDKLASPFQDLPTKDRHVNMEQADPMLVALVRPGEWIDCFDGDGSR